MSLTVSWPANPASPKALRMGCLVGVAPIELFVSHTYWRKTNDSKSETASILVSLYDSVSWTCKPSSAVSKIWRPFSTPGRIFCFLRYKIGVSHTVRELQACLASNPGFVLQFWISKAVWQNLAWVWTYRSVIHSCTLVMYCIPQT